LRNYIEEISTYCEHVHSPSFPRKEFAMKRTISMTLSLAMTLSGVGGCMRTDVAKVAMHSADDQSTIVERAPASGVYHVQLLDQKTYLHAPPFEADRYFIRGDPIGFRRDADGTLIGIAGEDEIKYPPLPQNATEVMWYRKMKRPTQFGREMQKATVNAADIAAAAVITTGVVVGLTAAVAIALSDDGCDNSSSSRAHHHRRSH
jgi:hypothetical protein